MGAIGFLSGCALAADGANSETPATVANISMFSIADETAALAIEGFVGSSDSLGAYRQEPATVIQVFSGSNADAIAEKVAVESPGTLLEPSQHSQRDFLLIQDFVSTIALAGDEIIGAEYDAETDHYQVHTNRQRAVTDGACGNWMLRTSILTVEGVSNRFAAAARVSAIRVRSH